jgi:hypothetical protein
MLVTHGQNFKKKSGILDPDPDSDAQNVAQYVFYFSITVCLTF